MKKLLRQLIDWFNKPKIVIEDIDDSSTVMIKVDGKIVKEKIKAYHVYSVNCNGRINYVTRSYERAMKDQCVFVKVDEISIED